MSLPKFSREVFELFNESQKSKISHGRLVKSLLKRYSRTGFDSFWPKFVTVIKLTCREPDRSPPAERLNQFIVKFILEANSYELKKQSTEVDEDGFGKIMAAMFKFCLHWHDASGHGVRLRCVQFISKLLDGMGSDAMLSETLFVDIQEMLLKRIWDVKPFIRTEATRALSRLQDPTDRDCPVVTAFLYLLRHDASPEVRKNAILSIAITTRTLPEVLTRTRDASDVVRRAVFEVIIDKVSLRPLTIAKRIKVLKDGMNDRSQIVREIVTKRLLPSWLSTRDNSPVMLLKALDVEGYPEECEKACIMLFENMRKTDSFKECVDSFVEEYLDKESRVPKIDKLCSESAFFWRVLVEYLKNTSDSPENEALLEVCLPLGNALCTFMRALLESYKEVPVNELEVRLVNEFIASHVISLAKSIDFTDEFGRNALKDFVRDSLIAPNSSVCFGLVSVLLDLLIKIDPRVVDSTFSNEVVEMISELREPMIEIIDQVDSTTLEETLPQANRREEELGVKLDRKVEMKLAALKVSINVAKEELNECVARMDFESAGPIRDQLKSLEEEKNRLLSKMTAEVKVENGNDVKETEGSDDSDEDNDEEKGLLCDNDTLIKANTIAVEFLKRVRSCNSLTPSLRTLVTSLILPSITNADPGVRNLAVTGLGLICIFDRGLAQKYLTLFGQISRVDHVAIRVSALKSLFDCFLVFGLDSFKNITFEDPTKDESREIDEDVTLANLFREEQSTMVDDDVKSVAESEFGRKEDETATSAFGQQTSLLSFIIELLDSEAAELRTVCVEGLARLVYLGLVTSSKLLSRLLLLWFNPLTEDDTTLRHCLAVFLPAFCFTKSDYQATMTEAVLPTLKTLFLAPNTSPLAKVDLWNVASLMIHLTDAANLFSNKCDKAAESKSILQRAEEEENGEQEAEKENVLVPGQKMKPPSRPVPKLQDSTIKLENPCHDELALSVSNALLNNVEPEMIRVYVRMLTNLRISTVNLPLRKELYVLVHKIFQKKILDKMQVRSLQKFHENLKADLRTANVNLEALLVPEEKEEKSTTDNLGKDRRMAALLAEEKRRRKMRRSSFTRGLCGSDEEPTLLETTIGVPDRNPGPNALNKTTANATMLERTYIGSKFKERGNLTIGAMAYDEIKGSTVLVNDSEDEQDEQDEQESQEADTTIVKSETDDETAMSNQTQSTGDTKTLSTSQLDDTMETSVKEEPGQDSERVDFSSSYPSTASTTKEESPQDSSVQRESRSSPSKKPEPEISKRRRNSKVLEEDSERRRKSDRLSRLSVASVSDGDRSSQSSPSRRRRSNRNSKTSVSGVPSSQSETASQSSDSAGTRRKSGPTSAASSRRCRIVQDPKPEQLRRKSAGRIATRSRHSDGIQGTSPSRIPRRTSAGHIEVRRVEKRVTRSSLTAVEGRFTRSKK